MKECILLFQPPGKKSFKIEAALMPLHIRIRKITKENYNQPLGALAGDKDVPIVDGVYEGDELPDTMFVFCGLTDARLNQVLLALRKSGAGPFPYKAILTPTNKTWTAPDCFSEIKKEHELMHGQKS